MTPGATAHQAESVDEMERRVREMYDYDLVIANTPAPETVEWVFGYGSIVFRQGFDAGHSVAGFVKDWRRGFYQTSTGLFLTLPGHPLPVCLDADFRIIYCSRCC